MIRNTIHWRDHLAHLRGSHVQLDLSPYDAPLAAIEALGESLRGLSDKDLRERARQLSEEPPRESRSQPTSTLDDRVLPFALAREAADRALGLRPYPEQLVAGLAMTEGKVVEMQTGEGKTLAAVLPAFYFALDGRGVHILTFNDYLATRDAQWMGPVFERLGMRAECVHDGMDTEARRRAYAADVTYVTAKEAGFDHLRDMLVTDPDLLVHRPFHVALVDEADSLLIDEARIPLVIAGRVESGASEARRLADLVRRLQAGRDYDTEPSGRNVELTEEGFDRAESLLGCGNLLDDANYRLFTELNCALHAQVLLRKDADYIVREGRLELVDEHTGRVVDDRHWPDGLQAALEAKEGLERSGDGRILGSITLQHFLAGYPELSGMTGTAQDAAQEIHDLYDLGVVVLPTHRPMIRIDRPDRVFTHREAKEQAMVEEIRQAHAQGRPVLVGTLTVAESERLAKRLEEAGIPCRVLNAKNDAREAEIVARAGRREAVTIATNMAGRGTDICLGDGVAELGGLFVLASHRHESQRVDRQLKGRAGRQGDPGETCTFVSLEDELMVRNGMRSSIPSKLMPQPQLAPIDNPVLRNEVARAQRILEGQNLEIRKTLYKYAEPIEEQRRMLLTWRRELLLGRTPYIWRRLLTVDNESVEVLDDDSVENLASRYRDLLKNHGADAMAEAERSITLHLLDLAWSDHLALVADLREGNHLVGLGGEDPLTRFCVETAEAFHRIRPEVEAKVQGAFQHLRMTPQGPRWEGHNLRGPSATWTYLIHDDPFRAQLGRMLTGPGNSTLAIGAALTAPVFLVLWMLADKFLRKRRGKP